VGLRRKSYATIAAKFHAAPLGGSQGRFRAGGNHAGLELGHRGHLLQQKLPVAPSIAGKSAKRTFTPASSRRDRKATEWVSRSTLATTSGTCRTLAVAKI
jgi:hypothetical protein